MNGLNNAFSASESWYYTHATGFTQAAIWVTCALIAIVFAIFKHDMLIALFNVALFIPVMVLVTRKIVVDAKHHYIPGKGNPDNTATLILSRIQEASPDQGLPSWGRS